MLWLFGFYISWCDVVSDKMFATKWEDIYMKFYIKMCQMVWNVTRKAWKILVLGCYLPLICFKNDDRLITEFRCYFCAVWPWILVQITATCNNIINLIEYDRQLLVWPGENCVTYYYNIFLYIIDWNIKYLNRGNKTNVQCDKRYFLTNHI